MLNRTNIKERFLNGKLKQKLWPYVYVFQNMMIQSIHFIFDVKADSAICKYLM